MAEVENPNGVKKTGDMMADAEDRLNPQSFLKPSQKRTQDHPQDQAQDQDQKQKRVSYKLFFLLVVLTVLAGGGAWYAFSDRLAMDPNADIPLIRADFGPVKVRPDNPGGMTVPDRDKLVYDRMKGEGERPVVERLLPPAETPLPPMPPEGTAISAEAGPASESAIPQPPPGPTAAEVRETKMTPLPPPPPEPKPQATPSAVTYQVQLAAARSRESAEKEWRLLKSKHADVLKSFSPTIVKVDLGVEKGIYFRLRAGPVATEAAARSLCASLAKRKVRCLVVKNRG